MTRKPSEKLAEYRAKRKFNVTPEPSGDEAPPGKGDSFVIQKHAASHLHYDFRLELDGVLLSWAVPKGPSLQPGTRRMAARTEDHPLDYAGFEGIIPADEYGGGSVVVWDRGTWKPDGDPQAGMKKGRLTFELDGVKLKGRWHLVRTAGGDRGREQWLLFKGRDEHASDTVDIVAERPESVISGRTVEEVAKDADRVWHSNRPPEPKGPGKALRRHQRAKAEQPSAAPAGAGMLEQLVARLPSKIPLTNLDKVLWPESGLTKGALLAYLAVVSDWMLPQLAGRPLTLVRCPNGYQKHCFFQKHAKDGVPEAVKRIAIQEEEGPVADYMMVDDLAGLLALAQLGVLELHTWGSHADDVEKPDQLVFDIDPDVSLGWSDVVETAFDLRQRLGDLGLDTFVKTTGGKGLHVVAPIKRTVDWDEFKLFAMRVAEQMESDQPRRYTTNMSKRARKGRLFVDYLRNGRGATAVVAYSPRARAGATVATPITWEELSAGVDPASFDITTVPKRLGALKEDPWKGYAEVKQSITAAARKALGMKK